MRFHELRMASLPLPLPLALAHTSGPWTYQGLGSAPRSEACHEPCSYSYCLRGVSHVHEP